MVASVSSSRFVGCSRSPSNAVAPEVATEHLLKETVEPGTQAKNQPVKGGVVLLLSIGPDGQVLDDKVLSTPDPMQTQTAEHSVASWKYRPFVKGNTAECAETTAFVAFSANK
jgi:outer membrane biosynthesis protein TonB